MVAVKNGRVIFNSIPAGFPEPGKTTVYDESETINLESVDLNGGVLIKVLELSIDPYFRGRMRDPSEKSYSEAFIVGKPLDGTAVGVVVRTENSRLKAGDHVYGILPHQHYFVTNKVEGFRVLDNPSKLPWSSFVGVLGMPGLTAYSAWREFSHAKKGEVAFVTAAAGPVGSLVIQLAKLDGLKVIASAGSEEKVEFLKEIGADVAFNYKTTSTAEVLSKEAGLDVYWDNVGGEVLDLAFKHANVGARFIECGMISGYNKGYAPTKNFYMVFEKSLSINGFIVTRLTPKHATGFYEFVPPRVASGEIRYKEHVFGGLDAVGEAILAVQKGTNKAKAVVHVADDWVHTFL